MGARREKAWLVVWVVVAAVFAAVPASASSPWSGPFRSTTNSHTFEQAPDWLPGGGVVSHDRRPEQIVTSRLDGSEETCLTCDTILAESRNMVPTAQPHGDWVLFHSWHGHALTVGAPGFGGMGADLWAVRRDGTGEPVRLTDSEEGHDNFHAYWSPDGKRIVWTALNWNFITEDGNGRSEIRVARFRAGGPEGARLESVKTVRPQNGHWYETQWWAPDGSGFLYTESFGESLDNELFFCGLPRRMSRVEECRVSRLTDHPAWDEQALLNPGAFNDYEAVAQLLGIPPDLDYALILPVFEFGFLQPVFQQANDLFDIRVRRIGRDRFEPASRPRRLTHSGDRGWVTPEFAFAHDAGRRLLYTQVKINDGLRIDQRLDLLTEVRQAVELLTNPEQANETQLGIVLPTEKRTRIGRYRPR